MLPSKALPLKSSCTSDRRAASWGGSVPARPRLGSASCVMAPLLQVMPFQGGAPPPLPHGSLPAAHAAPPSAAIAASQLVVASRRDSSAVAAAWRDADVSLQPANS